MLERFERGGVTTDHERLFTYLLWYGVLGVVNAKNEIRYIYDVEYNMNRLEAEVKTQKDEPLFVVNAALHVALST